MENRNERKRELYNELRQKFDEYHVALAFAPNAYFGWWTTCSVEDEDSAEVTDEFMSELAEIIERYVKEDRCDPEPDTVFDEAWILVNCESNSIIDYANRIKDRMVNEIDLANYTREKFLNDLIDAVDEL